MKKEWNSDTGCNMNDPWKHYAKWKKSDTTGHVLCGSIYMKYPKIKKREIPRVGKSIEQSWLAVTRVCGDRKRGVTAHGPRTSFWVMKDLELDSGDGCLTLWIYLMLLDCVLYFILIVYLKMVILCHVYLFYHGKLYIHIYVFLP